MWNRKGGAKWNSYLSGLKMAMEALAKLQFERLRNGKVKWKDIQVAQKQKKFDGQ